jgi:[ribosomal protein S18]-alanine N-acetyltransferase
MNSPFASVRVRRMTQADLDRVIEIAGSLKEAPQWPRLTYLVALDSVATPFRITLVAENPETGELMGFAVASLVPPEAELESIAVAPPFHRRGLARRLFAALTSELRLVQVAEVFLEVRASNFPALALYRSLGFVEMGRRSRYYHDPVEDALVMRLRLE